MCAIPYTCSSFRKIFSLWKKTTTEPVTSPDSNDAAKYFLSMLWLCIESLLDKLFQLPLFCCRAPSLQGTMKNPFGFCHGWEKRDITTGYERFLLQRCISGDQWWHFIMQEVWEAQSLLTRELFQLVLQQLSKEEGSVPETDWNGFFWIFLSTLSYLGDLLQLFSEHYSV